MKKFEYGLQITKWYYKDVIFPEFESYTVAIDENELIFKKYLFKYLEVKAHDNCNIFSEVQERLYIKGEGLTKQMWQNNNNW